MAFACPPCRYFVALKVAQNELAYIALIKKAKKALADKMVAGLVTGGVTLGQYLVARMTQADENAAGSS